MLEYVSVSSDFGQDFTFPMMNDASGFSVRDISGLDQVKSELVSADYAIRDGELFHHARRGSRNLVFRLGLDSRRAPGTSNSDLRLMLNSIFPSGSEVRLEFKSVGKTPRTIAGRVETVDANPFTKDLEGVVSVICHDPDFVDTQLNVRTGVAFRTEMVQHEVIYKGTVPSGPNANLTITTDVDGESFVTRSVDPLDNPRNLNFFADLNSGDEVRLVTHPGSKNARVVQNGVGRSILYGIELGSKWPMFFPGRNLFGIQVTGTMAQCDYVYSWRDRYGEA